jgi:divalent metal cation (Fe/Co/Zn/Cd) transporter
VWFLYLCGAVGTLANIAAVLFIFVGQWNAALFPTLAEWNTWMIWITALSVIIGIAIYAISQQTRRGKSDAELLVEVPDVATAGSGGGP